MENMEIWKKVNSPPDWAKRPIQFGALKGKTDINPQWRMQAMTEAFGPVGFGWTYSIDRLWLEQGHADEVCAFALVTVKVKLGSEWSEPFQGIGGSSFTSKTKNGVYTSDECYKMATTDALSVAFKAVGVGAQIYSGFNDGSKYQELFNTPEPPATIDDEQLANLEALAQEVGADLKKFAGFLKVEKLADLPKAHYPAAVKALEHKRSAA